MILVTSSSSIRLLHLLLVIVVVILLHDGIAAFITQTTTTRRRRKSFGEPLQQQSTSGRRAGNHHNHHHRHHRDVVVVLYQATSECCDSDKTPIPEGGQQQQQQQKTQEEFPPTILDPFPLAADPTYAVRGPVGEGNFIVSRCGGPTAEELSNENILKILVRGSNVYNHNNNIIKDVEGSDNNTNNNNNICVTDLEVNTLVWKCLGYRFDEQNEIWTPEMVFPKWKEKFPTPPDLIGMQRIYSSKAVDGMILKNNQHLVRSVPADKKQGLRTHLRPLGFMGYKLSELTPNLTRRAQCSNWLLYYRDELFGVTLEELQERRRLKQQQQQELQQASEEEVGGREVGEGAVTPKWTPPVTEVF